jgi:hypothetical protein
MYFKVPLKEGNIVIDSSHAILLIFTTLFTMVLGLVPNFVIGLLG